MIDTSMSVTVLGKMVGGGSTPPPPLLQELNQRLRTSVIVFVL